MTKQHFFIWLIFFFGGLSLISLTVYHEDIDNKIILTHSTGTAESQKEIQQELFFHDLEKHKILIRDSILAKQKKVIKKCEDYYYMKFPPQKGKIDLIRFSKNNLSQVKYIFPPTDTTTAYLYEWEVGEIFYLSNGDWQSLFSADSFSYPIGIIKGSTIDYSVIYSFPRDISILTEHLTMPIKSSQYNCADIKI